MKALGLFVSYVATILAANFVTTHYGLVHVGFGLMATAGTWFIGVLFILRDLLQDVGGKRIVLAAIAAGAALSYAVSAPALATASLVAFALSECIDFGIYTPLRKRGYVRAAMASNVVGTLVDTFVFLSLAAPTLAAFDPHFSVSAAWPGQIIGKLTLTALVVLPIALWRGARRLHEAIA